MNKKILNFISEDEKYRTDIENNLAEFIALETLFPDKNLIRKNDLPLDDRNVKNKLLKFIEEISKKQI